MLQNVHRELPSCIWVRNNYVTILGIYVVLPVAAGANVSLDRTAPATAKAVGKIEVPAFDRCACRLERHRPRESP